MWQWGKLWYHARSGAKPLKQVKHSMQENSKLETSKGTYTMAMWSKPQTAKGNQNSHKAGQDKTKTMLGPNQHKLEQKTKSMKHARLIGGITLHLSKPNMAWLWQQKSELWHVKISQKTHLDGIPKA